MPSARSMTAELARLLAGVAVPVYLIDAERRFVYCNAACADWLGVAAEELVGQTVGYHSSPAASPLPLKLAGLCPPPEAFLGRRTSGMIAALTEGASARREAEFLPLADEAGSCCGVLAVGEAVDLPDEAAATDGGAAVDESAALHARLQQLHGELRRHAAMDRLLGDSPAMLRARAQVGLAATGRASVLVIGPRGSGRQLVARAIHYQGISADAAESGELMPLSCAELGTELLRSTLTALLRETTTHAGVSKVGTVLLNDVDELPPEVQVELVDALSARRPLPLRIVATAQAPLDRAAGAGRFRADLACALSTIAIHLPPLAERPGDVPLLAQMFLEEFNAEGGRQLRGFAPEALDQLAAYPWPGNINELAAVVREAFEKAGGPEIALADLPHRLFLAAAAARQPRRLPQPIVLTDVLADIERQLIQRALRLAKGNKAKAARLLGLPRPRLYRRMVQLGLEEGEAGMKKDEG